MKILVVCDAINKFIGEQPETCKKIAKFMDNFRTSNENNDKYIIALQRVVEKNTKNNADLNAAVLHAATGEAEMPKLIHEQIMSHENAIVFRKSLNPFDISQPDLNKIIEIISDFVTKKNKKIEHVTIYFASKDKIPNYAVIKAFKEREELKNSSFSYVFIK